MQIPDYPPDILMYWVLIKTQESSLTRHLANSLTMYYYTWRTLVFSLKWEGKFLKISEFPVRSLGAVLDPVLLLHLSACKNPEQCFVIVFSLCSGLDCMNSPHHCTQKHQGLCGASAALFITQSSFLHWFTLQFLRCFMFFLIDLILTQIAYLYILFFRIYVTL